MIKMEQFISQLTKALVEKDVENVYRQLFQMGIPDSVITSPYGGDGMLKSKAENLIALLEFKYDYDFTSRKDTIKVLIQALYYLKKAESAGDILPSIIFIGDKNECFVVHINSLQKYLDADVDWTIAPSSAGSKNADLALEMFNDKDVNPFVFDVGPKFDFSEVINKILDLNSNVVRLVRITEKNINNIFEYFVGKVLSSKKWNTNAQVGLFINILTNPGENYIHPKKKNTLITPHGEITVKGAKFASFFSHFEREYKPSEKENLISISDRLIEDETRRREGAFFTPTIWVDEAHKMITEQFGPDWKDEYVVWDCACGTGNLTRDYKFKELYCSTLVQEIDTMIQNRVNPEAVRFQHDFLQDVPDHRMMGMEPDWDVYLPEGLAKALDEGRKILFLINPPYGTAGDIHKGSDHKAGIAINSVNAEMKADKLGACSQQLYAQFMYKIARIKQHYSLTDMNLCQFSPPLFLTGGSYKKFRSYWLNHFEMTDGMVFQASNFSDVSTQWGILFSIWKTGGHPKSDRFPVEVKKQVPIEGLGLNKIQTIGIKKFYHLDNVTKASDWIREEVKGLKTYDAPQISSGCTVKQKGLSSIVKGALGYSLSSANNVYENCQNVALFSDASSRGHGLSVIPDNFRKVCALFTARKTIKSNWLNQKDEYKAPNIEHPDYEQWNNDAIIYSLFNTSSNQSSLRNITYKGKQWDIENEWFWMPLETIKNLANEYNTQAVYDDCKTFGKERHVYTTLNSLILSDDASEVLAMATELVSKSFKFREMMNEEHPEYHLNSWDAGWYQIVKILKEYLPDELKAFRVKYKEFEDRMRPGVYQFGFLRK